MTLVKRLDDRAQLRSIAEAGARKAIAEIRVEAENTYYSMTDMWSNNPAAFKGVNLGAGTFTVGYDYLYDPSKAAETKYGLIDEERKININKTDRVILERLFKMILDTGETDAQGLAASIVDWRDSDSELSAPLGSAEALYYHGLTYPYEPKNADFEVLDELLLVKDINENIFEKIKEYVTVYGSGRVNVNTASKPVLLALGLSEYIVNNIISYRLGKDGVSGTADDGVFDSDSAITPKLSQFMSLSPSDIAQLTAVTEQYLSVASSAFKIYSRAVLKNNKTAVTTAVADKNGKVLYWQEP